MVGTGVEVYYTYSEDDSRHDSQANNNSLHGRNMVTKKGSSELMSEAITDERGEEYNQEEENEPIQYATKIMSSSSIRSTKSDFTENLNELQHGNSSVLSMKPSKAHLGDKKKWTTMSKWLETKAAPSPALKHIIFSNGETAQDRLDKVSQPSKNQKPVNKKLMLLGALAIMMVVALVAGVSTSSAEEKNKDSESAVISEDDVEVANEVTVAQTVCSCSPRVFTFKLDFSATCPPLPPPFPPNSVFGAGVKDYTCSIGSEPVPFSGQKRDGESETDYQQHFDALQPSDFSTSQLFENSPDTASGATASDSVPVLIDSIQFLEVDVDFNVINQDPTYVKCSFTNGDVFNYTSISAQDPDPSSYPGGLHMVLRGDNAAGDFIRNVFTISYTNDCGVQTFNKNETIGWVIFVRLFVQTDLI